MMARPPLIAAIISDWEKRFSGQPGEGGQLRQQGAPASDPALGEECSRLSEIQTFYPPRRPAQGNHRQDHPSGMARDPQRR